MTGKYILGFTLAVFMYVVLTSSKAEKLSLPGIPAVCQIAIFYPQIDRRTMQVFIKQKNVLAKGYILSRIQKNYVRLNFKKYLDDNSLSYNFNPPIKIIPVKYCSIVRS